MKLFKQDISLRQFNEAMKILGVEQVQRSKDPKYEAKFPTFAIGNTRFSFSSTMYAIADRGKIPDAIIAEATKKEVEDFHFKKSFIFFVDMFSQYTFYTLESLLIVITLMQGRYSKELVQKVILQTFEKMLDCPEIKKVPHYPVPKDELHAKTETLRKPLSEYVRVVNPFTTNGNLQEISTILGKVDIRYIDDAMATGLEMKTNKAYARFSIDNHHYFRFTTSIKGRHIIEYYSEEKWDAIDEFIDFTHIGKDNKEKKITLSLRKGLIWKNDKEWTISKVTSKQISRLEKAIKSSTEMLRAEIASNIWKK